MIWHHFNKTTRIIIGLALAVIIWIVGILIGQEQTLVILEPEGGLKSLISRTPTVKVSLMLDYGNGAVTVYPDLEVAYGQSILQLLNKLAKTEKNKLKINYQLAKDNSRLSDFSLNGFVSYSGGRQWQAWVNNQLQSRPLNLVKLKARDIVELKYINLISSF